MYVSPKFSSCDSWAICSPQWALEWAAKDSRKPNLKETIIFLILFWPLLLIHSKNSRKSGPGPNQFRMPDVSNIRNYFIFNGPVLHREVTTIFHRSEGLHVSWGNLQCTAGFTIFLVSAWSKFLVGLGRDVQCHLKWVHLGIYFSIHSQKQS